MSVRGPRPTGRGSIMFNRTFALWIVAAFAAAAAQGRRHPGGACRTRVPSSETAAPR